MWMTAEGRKKTGPWSHLDVEFKQVKLTETEEMAVIRAEVGLGSCWSHNTFQAGGTRSSSLLYCTRLWFTKLYCVKRQEEKRGQEKDRRRRGREEGTHQAGGGRDGENVYSLTAKLLIYIQDGVQSAETAGQWHHPFYVIPFWDDVFHLKYLETKYLTAITHPTCKSIYWLR